MKNITISTIGNWQILPELYGFINKEDFDLYQNSCRLPEINKLRKEYSIKPADEIWLVGTSGKFANDQIINIKNWIKEQKIKTIFRFFTPTNIDDPVSVKECKYMSDLIYRVVYNAKKVTAGGQFILSLAGGRKTMSADLQEAAYTFGCDLVLHITSSETADKNLKSKLYNFDFKTPFPREIADLVMPIVSFGKLKDYKVGASLKNIKKDYQILQKLPKTELHCHLGGILDAEDMILVALESKKEIEVLNDRFPEYKKFTTYVKKLCDHYELQNLTRKFPDFKEIRTLFKNSIDPDLQKLKEPYTILGFLSCFEKNPKLLDEYIFRTLIVEENYFKIGINKYEELGDLQGSGILQNEKSIRKTIQILREKTRKHNVKYIEVRCSPANYTRGGLTKEQVYKIIKEELEKDDFCTYSIIFIASRHGKDEDVKFRINQHIELAKTILKNGNEGKVKLTGFDVAGDEKAKSPKELRKFFLPIMEKCLKITTHAGETVDVDSIWQAVYHLNAERIGHGLKLEQNKKLLDHILDRKITIELCPSSNFQIVGYKDFLLKNKEEKTYPLKKYLDTGLKVCLNTDNPGISRTDFTKEFLKAAQMTKDGLSLWEILILIRNGFKASFLDYEQRRIVLRNAEQEILDLIMNYELLKITVIPNKE